MFIECPFCQTKLSVDPDGIPELGREKRCVNCFNRFRVVRTPDEVVIQFQQSDDTGQTVDAGRSEGSLHANVSGISSSVEEKRYPLPKAGDGGGEGFDPGGGSGVFADFFESPEPAPDPTAASQEDTSPEMEIPAEQNLQLDEVFGQLSGEDSFSPSDAAVEPRKPRLLTSKDLMDRKAKDYKRSYRVDGGGGESKLGGLSNLVDLVDRVVSNLTPIDLLLLVVFLVVVGGAGMGFTSAGFFGMNWFADDELKAEQAAAARKQQEAHLSRAEVYKLIELISDDQTGAKAKPGATNRELLPSGDYDGLFVEEVSVAVRSTPPGARVWRDDEMIGVTPLLLRLAKKGGETMTLRVEKEGFQARNLTFDQGESHEYDLNLSTRSAASGSKKPRSGKKRVSTSKKNRPVKDKPAARPTEDDFIIY